MLKADLYFDKIDFYKYLPRTDCGDCGLASCKELIERLKTGGAEPEVCSHLSKNMVHAFKTTLEAERIIPEIGLMQLPVAAKSGLVEFNMPDRDSPLLISGNSELTQVALSAILVTTVRPFYALFVDTRGDTVDMAMIYGTLTEEHIRDAIHESNIVNKLDHREMVIPGFARSLNEEIKRLTGWNVDVGPVCCGELPLYFGEIWTAP